MLTLSDTDYDMSFPRDLSLVAQILKDIPRDVWLGFKSSKISLRIYGGELKSSRIS